MAKTKNRKSQRKRVNANANTKERSDESGTRKESISSVEEITELLWSLKETPGKFATNGVLKGSPFPGLNIEGVGPISLPLYSDQAKKIVEVATQAPFGLGEKTIVDENIRKTWSLHPDQFTLENPQFHTSLESLVLKVKEELGCDSKNVEANLYKLLLYEEGGHFKPHRDSEKEDGMFATLIIQLPSVFKGNQLIVRHGGQTKIVEFDVKESKYEMIYAAHYADCEHEITPLQSGYRMALIYNLVWTSSTEPPSIAQNKLTRLTSLLPQVANEHKNVFGFSMEHKYSPISLQNGMAALKGKDHTIAVTLQTANKELGKDDQLMFYIVKVQRETVESGQHEGWEDSDDSWYGEFESIEIFKDTTYLDTAYDLNGEKHELKNIPFNVEKDLLDFEARYDSELDQFWGDYEDEEVEGPTGNEGSSRNRWYNNYIMLAIPESQKFRMLCKCSSKSALENLYDDFKTSAVNFKDHLKTFLNEIPANCFANEEAFFIKIVEILQSTCDVELINLFIVNVLQKRPTSSSPYFWIIQMKPVIGLHYKGMEKIISDLFKSVDWPSIRLSVEHLIEISPTVQYDRWFKLHSTSGINDICHKLIEVILSKLKAKQWLPSEEDHTVFVQLFHAVSKCEELSNRWWTEISSCVEITSNINLLAKIIARLPVDDETNKYTFLIESFVDCLNHASDLRSDVEKYASIIFAVIKPIFIDNKFQKYLVCLRNSLVETNSVPIIGRLLGLLYRHDKSWSKMQNFQMLLSVFMDWIHVVDLNKLRNEELINVAKVLYHHDEYSKDKTQNCLTPSQKIQIHNAIQRIEVAGPPKLSNQQPDAVIVGHQTVQTFLRGSEKRFEYQNFTSIGEARSWVKKHFSLQRDQISKGYCCSVETIGAGKKARAILTKIPDHFHNEKKNAYDNLFKELRSLLLNVSWKSASKRQQPMASETAPKKQAIENFD